MAISQWSFWYWNWHIIELVLELAHHRAPRRKHRELIGSPAARSRALNNKAKVTMRKAYGFRTFRATEVALYHVLGKLPEPQLYFVQS